MNILQFLGFTLAPSLTLGLVVFMVRNWFLERLKNSIKHEYDMSLESFKSDLKIENDKELEEIKALLKKQTDANLEDYRFKIEIRKKWLNDVREASIEYLFIVRGQINLVQTFVIANPSTNNSTMIDENYKKSLEKISNTTVDLGSVTFKLETLIVGLEPIATEIFKNMKEINDLVGTMSINHHTKRQPILPNTKEYIDLQESINKFKNNVMNLLKEKTENF
ncbi:hypothetical protein [Acinetobacter nosocomialis]|uniref:hypothetical protein n=1 Tax=Acinetobacter nosocomialis TaxID=106654 RepID=UPI00124EC1C3|nr:hypothetical protein [Acinetobacter nosocomialis]